MAATLTAETYAEPSEEPIIKPLEKTSLQVPEIKEAYHKYIEHVNKTLLNLSGIIKELVTEYGLKSLTKFLFKMKEKVERNEIVTLSEKEQQFIEMYDIGTIKNRKYIYTKPKPGEKRRRVISCEDAFFIIYKIHYIQTKHGNFSSMRKTLNNYTDMYVYKDEFCITTVINECTECTPIFNFRCYVSIMNLPLIDNEDMFRYVLLAVDDSTSFVRLRPLSSNVPHEVAVELLKIFMDFGIPDSIITKNVSLLVDVTKVMASLSPDYKLPPVLSIKSSAQFDTIVKTHLIKFKKGENHKSWGMVCHMVQWSLNTQKNNNKTTPYRRVFGKDAPGIIWQNPHTFEGPVINKACVKPAELSDQPDKLRTLLSSKQTDKDSAEGIIKCKSWATFNVIEKPSKKGKLIGRSKKTDTKNITSSTVTSRNKDVVAFESMFNLVSKSYKPIENIDLTESIEKEDDDVVIVDVGEEEVGNELFEVCCECKKLRDKKDMIKFSSQEKTAVCKICIEAKEKVSGGKDFNDILDDFESQIDAIAITVEKKA